jgi:hypothetical protein
MQTQVSLLTKPLCATERRKYFRILADLPLEYKKVGDTTCRGAYTGDVSKKGLLVHSVDNMLLGTELEISVFYEDEYRLDIFSLFGKIVWKQPHSSPDWKGYRYGLEVVRISAEDRRKLDTLIARQVAFGKGGSEELNTILNSGPSRPCVILTQRRVGGRGFKETLIRLLERHSEEIVFAVILLILLMAT